MKRPFNVVVVPAFIIVADGVGTRIANIRQDGTTTDAEMQARAQLIALALNRLAKARTEAVK